MNRIKGLKKIDDMKTKVTFLISSLIVFMSSAQTIDKFSIDSGGASITSGGIEVLYTIGEANVQELSVGGVSVSEGFINTNFSVLIDPKVFLQGPLLNPTVPGLMNDDLRFASLLPTTSPYSDNAEVATSVFNAGGSSGTGLAQNDIVDWVWVELRAANDNTKLINEKSALLQRDGDVVALDGVSNLIMMAAPTNYYVAVKHRNHLGTMSSSASFGLTEVAATVVDFKSNAVPTFGSNARVDLGSGVMALWTGDTNNGNQIKFSGAGSNANIIKDAVLADPGNGFNSVTYTSSGYLLIDINLDGKGKFSGAGNDSNIIKDNVLAHPANGFNSPTFTINNTVPIKN